MKKPILCPNCNLVCTEVQKDWKGVRHYPKEIYEPGLKKRCYEYRYYCRNCTKEWIHNTNPKVGYIDEVPKEAQYIYDDKRGYLIINSI